MAEWWASMAQPFTLLDYSCLLLNILHRETLFCWSLVRTQEKNDRWVSLGAHLEEGGLGGVVAVCWGSLLSLSWKKWVNFRCRLKPDFFVFVLKPNQNFVFCLKVSHCIRKLSPVRGTFSGIFIVCSQHLDRA